MAEAKTNRRIPRTKLREIYKLLDTCSSKQFHLSFAKELASRKNPKKFAKYLDEDIRRFHAYDNTIDRLFDGDNARKRLRDPGSIQKITSTDDIAALLDKQKSLHIFHPNEEVPIRKVQYVEREIRPCRTKNHAKYVDGLPAAAQQHLDLLLVADRRRPALGEVKIRGDKNPFYALIQLLMYASELLGEYQRTRVLESFPGTFSSDYKSLDLYIVLHQYRLIGKYQKPLLEMTDQLADKLISYSIFNKHIRSIHCIDLKLKRESSGPYLEADQLFSHSRV